MQMSSEEQSLSQKTGAELRVEVSYGDLKTVFSGDVESVLHSIDVFIAKELPAFNIAKKLSLSYGAREVAEKFQDYVCITPEGPRLWPQEKKLSDKEVVALQLAAQIIAHDAGKVSSSSMPLSKLQETTNLIPKTLSSRLSELSKSGFVSREPSEEGPLFKLTTQGVSWLSDALAKKSN